MLLAIAIAKIAATIFQDRRRPSSSRLNIGFFQNVASAIATPFIHNTTLFLFQETFQVVLLVTVDANRVFGVARLRLR